MDYVTIAIIIIPLLLIMVYVSSFNRLNKLKNAAEATLGQVRVAMKKRLDMIEQLLGAVQSYTKFEREVFENIAKMRSGLMNANPSELNGIDSTSRSLVGRLLAVAEAYPELKASETTMKLMDATTSVEGEIARHRYTFNNVVQEYNTMQDTIPSNIVAGMMGAKKLEYLEFEEDIEKTPNMSVT